MKVTINRRAGRKASKPMEERPEHTVRELEHLHREHSQQASKASSITNQIPGIY